MIFAASIAGLIGLWKSGFALVSWLRGKHDEKISKMESNFDAEIQSLKAEHKKLDQRLTTVELSAENLAKDVRELKDSQDKNFDRVIKLLTETPKS